MQRHRSVRRVKNDPPVSSVCARRSLRRKAQVPATTEAPVRAAVRMTQREAYARHAPCIC